MENQTLIIITAVVVPIVFIVFWWESKASGCAFGGSSGGTDNWLISVMKQRVQKYRTRRSNRALRDVSDI